MTLIPFRGIILLIQEDVMKTLLGIFNGTVGLVFWPVVLSLAFCLLTGIPFVKFWTIVFTVFSQWFAWLLSFCTPAGLAQIQEWFRFMIF